MTVIHKNVLPPPGGFMSYRMVRISDKIPIVHIGTQHGHSHFWFETLGHEPPNGNLLIQCIGTGWTIPIGFEHVGTIVTHQFVWHYYAKWE